MKNMKIDELDNVTGGCGTDDFSFDIDGDEDEDPMENFGNEGLDLWEKNKIVKPVSNPYAKKYSNKKKNILKY